MEARYAVAAALERMVGRRRLVRGSRFLLDYARRDLPNRLGVNGEWRVQDAVLEQSSRDEILAIDVGAHIGAWTRRLLQAARSRDGRVQVHAFEPSPAIYARLLQELHDEIESNSVVALPFAVSDHCGEGTLYEAQEMAGSNSLHGHAGDIDGLRSQPISLVTVDQYCAAHGFDHVDLLKVDAEGHDLLVLRGAKGLFTSKAIEVAQFEYNYRWIGARCYLKDAFDFLVPFDYIVGKLTPQAVEWYPKWDAELETFREGNYVAVLARWLDRFSSLNWWGSTVDSSRV